MDEWKETMASLKVALAEDSRVQHWVKISALHCMTGKREWQPFQANPTQETSSAYESRLRPFRYYVEGENGKH